jgi:hypothetical protein
VVVAEDVVNVVKQVMLVDDVEYWWVVVVAVLLGVWHWDQHLRTRHQLRG